MWIFLNDAFLSIVDKGGNGSTLLVRTRRRGDIDRVFPEAEVQSTPRNDYPLRARIPRSRVAEVIARRVEGLRYPNFKGSVAEPSRHDAYFQVWGIMDRYGRATQRRFMSASLDDPEALETELQARVLAFYDFLAARVAQKVSRDTKSNPLLATKTDPPGCGGGSAKDCQATKLLTP